MLSTRERFLQARKIWPPEPGCFSLRLVKKGWRVPARISLDPDQGWCAEVDETVHPAHKDPAIAAMIERVWTSGLKISEADYAYLIAVKAWARDNEPDHPCLAPYEPMDPLTLPPIQPRTPR